MDLKEMKTAVGLFALTAVSFLFTGYRYGVDDHIVHITRLLHILDPQLYAPDDPYILAQATHYSFFWYGVAPLAQLISQPLLFFVLTLLFRFLYAVAVWRLAMRLFGREEVAWLGTAALLTEKITLGFFILPDKSLLDRTFALPIVLYALERFLVGQRRLPYLLTGLVVNVHVLSALYTLPLLAVGSLAEMRKTGPWRLATGLGLFLVAGAPIWWWRLQAPNGLPLLAPDSEWLPIVKAAVVTLLNILVLDTSHLVVALSGLGFLVGYVLAQRDVPSDAQHKTVRLWVITSGTLVVAAVLFTDVWPISAVLQLQLVRIDQWLIVFPVLYSVQLLWSLFQHKQLSRAAFFGSVGSLIFGVFGFLPLLALAVTYLPRKTTWWVRGGAIAGAQLGALAISVLYLVAKSQIWPFLFAPPQNSWWEIERWVQQHTPKDAIVLIPPYARGAEMGSEFRVVAQRSTVTTYAEGGEGSFNKAFALAWYQRMHDLTGGAFSLAAPQQNTFGDIEKGFRTLSEEQLREVARRYRAGYILLEAQHTLSGTPLFANAGYAIYPVKPQ